MTVVPVEEQELAHAPGEAEAVRQPTRADLERERAELRARLREAAHAGDDAALRALKRRKAELDAQLSADADVDAITAARRRKEAIAQQRAELLAREAELEALAADLDPQRNAAWAAWAAIEEQWQGISRSMPGLEERLLGLNLAEAENDKALERAIERITGGES
jgi:hypothetical protein